MISDWDGFDGNVTRLIMHAFKHQIKTHSIRKTTPNAEVNGN